MDVSETETDLSSSAGVTTGSLARRLGVSPTTLRSWDRRYGLGPATRTQGRHRRWTPEDVAMVVEMCRLTAAGIPPGEAARTAKAQHHPQPVPVAPSRPPARPVAAAADVMEAVHASRSGSGLPLGNVRHECKGLARAAVRLDAVAVQEQLTSVIRAYGLVVTWEEILSPALQAVGRKWQSAGERYVEVEHLLSWHISATIRHVCVTAAPAQREWKSAPVILACLPGELHTLPLEALNAALAERGVATLMLGSAVPAEALTTAVERVGPSAVVLWSQSGSTASLPLAHHVASTRWGIRGARTQSRVLLAGPGWGRGQRPGLLRPRGLQDALVMLEAL
ncbi:MerR family transcriptional regulator [Streptomyces sp. CdTB01]|uniref:MerR family transcriptional regulator n=1 Tax=Streptomyces sp. CdTB01 TaxID=1725411 RepID=UPI00073AB2E9|nr:MerR family transcriptional regulator [Streptomyces sp. CdTB01]ALV31476.1 transcriptional regulator [Streptomyces sp. CdTB01]